ncbi:restriction endonuclease subunit S [Elizabethkingia anophelis]|nr:restriction endonuclease subunit S [Elizabethkingia anophelis]
MHTEQQISEGYKQTSVGVIPTGWNYTEFANFVTLSKKKYNPNESEVLPCIELEHFNQEIGSLNGWTFSNFQKSTKNVFEIGDILFGKLRPYLRKFWLAEFDGVCSSEVWVLKPQKNISNDFIYRTIQSNRFIQIANVSSGSKMPRADWDYVSEFPFLLPPLPEQQKIAEILSAWDKAIETCQKIIEEMKRRNKRLLNEIINSNLDEKVELGKLGKTFNGLVNKTKDDFGSGKPYISYLNVFQNFQTANNFQLVSILKDENQQRIKYGDILFTVSSETPEEVGMSSVVLFEPQELYLNSFCFGLRLYNFETLSARYASYYFRSSLFRRQVCRLAQGATRYNLSKTEFLKIEIAIAKIDSQNKIADILDTAASELKHYEEKLANLKLQKKGLMQQLLTGKVRTL